jgi:hypothetical protein
MAFPNLRHSSDATVDKSGWDWRAAQSRLAAAYERGGVARLAEAAVGEMEAELELERRKRGLGFDRGTEVIRPVLSSLLVAGGTSRTILHIWLS